MKRCNKKVEAGRSMIEMVGVLAVAGLLTAGAFVLIQSGMSSQKRRRAMDEMNTLAQSVRTLTAEGSKFTTLPGANETGRGKGGHNMAKALLKTNGVTPMGEDTYYVVTQSDAIHNASWYEYFGVQNDGTSVYFRVGLANLDEEDCKLLALEAWNGVAADASCVQGTAWFYFGK